MIVDASDLIVGRFATVVAKKSLLGEKIDIVNCDKAVLTGTKANVLAKYQRKRSMGTPAKGPFFPKMPDRFVRRVIRGMLPYKLTKGSDAYKRIMCYIGVPEEFEGKTFETVKEANISKLPNLKYIKVGEICKLLGAKHE
jgi:large subunit ribosomal protein L13